jgi:pimeloyl-ACP methyl ester carboxylesterase
MARLADRFQCLAPDLPGFGRSNRMAPASLDESADLVAELIETRVPARKAHLVGLSWGGGVAHALLDRHPELIERVVIDGAGVPGATPAPRWFGWSVRLGVTAVSPFLHTRPVIALFSGIIGMDEVGRDELRASSRRAFRRAFVEGFTPRPPLRVEAGVPCPTLLVAGEKETLNRPSNAALAAVMPHAVARFAPGLAHGWLARATELHVRMVEAWLTGQELPAELAPEPPSPEASERLRRALSTGPAGGYDGRVA